jgi:potassium-transporting ATPase KdpC subunit
MKASILISIKILFFLTLLTGVIYPLFITVFVQVVFPDKANGSLIMDNNNITGSKLIGQHFDSAIYFWSRPSAIDYNPLPSSGSNYGPTSNQLKMQYDQRKKLFTEANGLKNDNPVPCEMLFASASGLDPHISPAAALLQVDRALTARDFDESRKTELIQLIKQLSESPQFGIFGNDRINVLLLNIQLDKMK